MKSIKVSTITVTKNRCEFLKTSINHYLNQTHINKEMLIMYYSNDSETMKYLNSLDKFWRNKNNIRIFKHIPQDGIYLGSLRNHLISKASGDYVIIWDDDDYYSPIRIESQLNKILEDGLDGCTLRSLLLFSSAKDEVRLSFDRLEGWEGSLMCRRDIMPLYSNMQRYEDTPVLKELFTKHKAVSYQDPELYVYFLHDTNVSTSYHKEELFVNSSRLPGHKNYKIKKIIGVFK